MIKKIAAGAVAVVAAVGAVVTVATFEQPCAMRLHGMGRGICQRQIGDQLTDPPHGEPFAASEAVGACHPASCLSGELIAIERPDAGAR